MTTKWPLPRPIPKGVGFGSSHAELFRATQQFLRDVERAEHEGREEADAIQKKFGMPAPYRPTVHVERYSVAVQVFAAMTLEAVIDMYAVVRFGEDEVRSTWTRGKKPLVTKFGEMLKAATKKPLPDTEILQIARRIFKARNAILHPKSDEMYYDDSGKPLRSQSDHLFPDIEGNAARATWADLQRFFKLLHELDPDAGAMVYPW